MSHQKIILFNGPPRSGKDTAVKLALSYINTSAAYLRPVHMSFADPLKETTHKMYNAFFSPGHFENAKNTPTPVFFGKTPREAYIEVSERMVKPVLGQDHWGRVAVVKMNGMRANNVFLFSDSGFVEELVPIINSFGPKNVTIVELETTINGHGLTFSGDSRGYIGAEAKKQFPSIGLYRIPNSIDTDDPNLTMFSVLVSGICKMVLKLDDGD
jgi:hypothetical protein